MKPLAQWPEMKNIQRTHKTHQLHCLRHLWQDRNSNQNKKKKKKTSWTVWMVHFPLFNISPVSYTVRIKITGRCHHTHTVSVESIPEQAWGKLAAEDNRLWRGQTKKINKLIDDDKARLREGERGREREGGRERRRERERGGGGGPHVDLHGTSGRCPNVYLQKSLHVQFLTIVQQQKEKYIQSTQKAYNLFCLVNCDLQAIATHNNNQRNTHKTRLSAPTAFGQNARCRSRSAFWSCFRNYASTWKLPLCVFIFGHEPRELTTNSCSHNFGLQELPCKFSFHTGQSLLLTGALNEKAGNQLLFVFAKKRAHFRSDA